MVVAKRLHPGDHRIGGWPWEHLAILICRRRENGGGTFLVLYLIYVFVIGLPLVIAELALGRRAQGDAIAAFAGPVTGSHWRYAGVFGGRRGSRPQLLFGDRGLGGEVMSCRGFTGASLGQGGAKVLALLPKLCSHTGGR